MLIEYYSHRKTTQVRKIARRPVPMKQDNFKVYGYRWIVLVVFMLIVAATQLLWITFGAITSEATKF